MSRPVRLLLVVAAQLAAFAGLHVLLADWWWWLAGAIFVLIATGVAWLARFLARRVRHSGWIPPVAAAVVVTALLGLLFAPGESLLGIIPTVDSVARFGEVIAAGTTSIREQAIPAQATEGIRLILILTVSALAIVAESFAAARWPAIALVPVGVLLTIPLAVRADVADPLWYLVAGTLGLALLAGTRRGTARGRAVGPAIAGAGILVVSLAAPSVLPDAGPDVPAAPGLIASINPLVDVGVNLRRGAPIQVLEYTTSNGAGQYLRLATLSEFGGEVWVPNPGSRDSTLPVADFPPAPGLSAAVTQEELSASIEVGPVGGRWLPIAYPATSVEGVDDRWRVEERGLSVRGFDANVFGLAYDVDFLAVRPTAQQLREAPPAQLDYDATALPADLPEIIRQTAAEVAGGAGNAYDQAIALQSWLRGPQFTYSLDAPVDQGFDGSGGEAIAQFLLAKTGYCVHFSSAMALMARSLGIPSRVVVGFAPGARLQGQSAWTVMSEDEHAWPELYFEGVGWVRFEPTPGVGQVPNYELNSPPTGGPDPGEEPTPNATPAPTPTATSGVALPGDDPGSSAAGTRRVLDGLRSAGIAAGILALLASPAIARLLIRRARVRRIREGDGAEVAWQEFRDTLLDLGIEAPEEFTPRRLAAELGRSPDVRELVDAVERGAYGGRNDGPRLVAALRSARRSLAAEATAPRRILAALAPASLIANLRRRVEGRFG